MLLNAVSSHAWEEQFSSKFVNFAKKCPVLISMIIKIQQGEKGVLVTHVNSNSKYWFSFDYDCNPKDFIAQIKKVLVDKHYPRLVEEILEKHELSQDELVLKLEKGAEADHLNKYEMRVIGNRLFRIDKILAWKGIFILSLEQSSFKDDEIGTFFRYKFTGGSAVIFLKNYRSGKFKTLEEASEYFFSNSLLIDSITKNE